MIAINSLQKKKNICAPFKTYIINLVLQEMIQGIKNTMPFANVSEAIFRNGNVSSSLLPLMIWKK